MRAGQAIAFLLLLSSLSTAHCLAQVAPDLRPPQPPSNLEAPSSAPQVAAPSPSLAPSPVTTSSPLQTSPPDPSYQAAITLVTKNNLKFILALLAGWADVACIRQYKCFGIMMTGSSSLVDLRGVAGKREREGGTEREREKERGSEGPSEKEGAVLRVAS
eukprot:3757921-Rhodomonas_salina.2